MTLFSLRTGFALLLALSLASCGGGSDTTYPITGTVTGLAYDSLTLTAAGQTIEIKKDPATTATTVNPVRYSFPKSLSYGDPFLVALGKNPPNQNCAVGQTVMDSAGHRASIDIFVECKINLHVVSGKVTGLTSEGLELINGSTSGKIAVTLASLATTNAANGPSFAFVEIPVGQTYGVTILSQPRTQTCTVMNGAGTMTDADVTNVVIDCK